MKRNIKRLFKKGQRIQRKKLRQNEHKGSWSNASNDLLFKLLLMEVVELFEAISHDNNENIAHEAGDVANFAHMIIDNNV